jgi:polar amino acid transport system substrate-binding protein
VKDDDAKDYRSLADLKDEVIGVQVGTVYVDFLKKAGGFKEIKIYDSLADILRDLSLGRIRAGVGDRPILAYQLSQNKDFKAKLAKNYVPGMAGSIGIGLRKGDAALLDKVNKGLAKIKADGSLEKILEKWNLK